MKEHRLCWDATFKTKKMRMERQFGFQFPMAVLPKATLMPGDVEEYYAEERGGLTRFIIDIHKVNFECDCVKENCNFCLTCFGCKRDFNGVSCKKVLVASLGMCMYAIARVLGHYCTVGGFGCMRGVQFRSVSSCLDCYKKHEMTGEKPSELITDEEHEKHSMPVIGFEDFFKFLNHMPCKVVYYSTRNTLCRDLQSEVSRRMNVYDPMEL